MCVHSSLVLYCGQVIAFFVSFLNAQLLQALRQVNVTAIRLEDPITIATLSKTQLTTEKASLHS